MSNLILPDYIKPVEEVKIVPPTPNGTETNIVRGVDGSICVREPNIIKTELPPPVERDLEGLSRIKKEEIEEAKKFINEQLGFDAPTMAGYYMAVSIYIRPEHISQVVANDGTIKKIYLPTETIINDKYRSCVALVVAQGPDCYKGPRFQEGWFRRSLRLFFNRFMSPVTKYPWCKVGDWIVIPRNEGTQINYKGVPMQFIPDDRILAIVDDPSDITRS